MSTQAAIDIASSSSATVRITASPCSQNAAKPLMGPRS
jgi:hypothetical protein